jgi:DNA-binding beta-propeller fold protein YncE
MKNLKMLTGAIIIMASMAFSFSCERHCVDCPKEPEPPPEGHYRVYIYDAWNRFIMSLDTPSDTIADSIRIGYYGYGIFLAPDGERLLVTKYDGFTMEIYRTEDLAYLGSINRYGDYFFNGLDNYGICLCFPKNQIYFIDPINLNPVDSIAKTVSTGYLDSVSDLLYCTNVDTLYIIDCKNRSLLSTKLLYDQYSRQPIRVSKIAHNWLTDDIYILGGPDRGSDFFYQYSINCDSVLARMSVMASTGAVAISPDAKSVYMTDGGDGVHDLIPRGDIYIFDALTHGLKSIIPAFDYSSGIISYPCFGQLILAPDNRRAYLGSNSNALGGVPMRVVDLYKGRIISTIKPYATFDAASIVFGKEPK